MKKIFVLMFSVIFIAGYLRADEKMHAFGTIDLTKLSENFYVYTYNMPAGNYSANGALCIDKGEAVLIDTPGEDGLTDSLVNWVQQNLNVKIEKVIITHWHMEDRMGGLKALHQRGIISYANKLTIDKAIKDSLPVPQNGFTDSLTINVGEKEIVCFFPGAGHTIDNSVVWFPSDNILFGGCLVKDVTAKGLGYTADADLMAWPQTIQNVKKQFSNAKVIIPGHMGWGGVELLDHTYELLTKTKSKK